LSGFRCSWAFASAAVIDAAYKIKKNVTISSSKQELIDCSVSFGNQGCNGGMPSFAFGYAQIKGVGSESVYNQYNQSQVLELFFKLR
jgi:hypothetical protein